MSTPFRWDITKREQLGKLVEGEAEEPYPEFLTDLQQCCARVFSFCDNADLIFVGRSPESIYDYLSGLLAGTSWSNRICLLNISLRYYTISEIEEELPTGLAATYEQLEETNLAPSQIVRRSRPIALTDLVASGSTLGNLTELLMRWLEDERGDLTALREKLRYVGITRKKDSGKHTNRWQQDVSWTQSFRKSRIKNVAIPWRLWGYLGNEQKKVTDSNPPWVWGKSELQSSPRHENYFQALRLARHLYQLGLTRKHRLAFSNQLAKQPGVKFSWFRSLIAELRQCKSSRVKC
ncbi:MAG: hypothetical protein COA78_01340 [Blastopirellula sp.]|nr:MAG: hypothetical protein COA78_01340 [Blastopirellula sp.]